eukprot:TRINITY_DN9450_c0_g1::TRINITY_DN9450_c0_g1_i1::g.279::m.279 TRINITY_DN9450_c0_g1::TRINITY_DN9450_c0_g1_i1::g.279  ORF type:complete len:128 (-),score=0.16,C1_4/PF07975.7/2.7,C1_4/PF07975.7/1.1e+03 TRINITY_DN9450_c0_g1_i1:259-642(-)
MASTNARCSWCERITSQTLMQENGNSVKRSVYECKECKQRTLPCRKQCGAMARGGSLWDNENCSVCAGTIKEWPLTEQEKEERRVRAAQAAEKRATATAMPKGKSNPTNTALTGAKTEDLLNPGRWH